MRPCQMEQARRTSLQVAGLRAKTTGKTVVECKMGFPDSYVIAFDIKNIEGSCRFVDITQHVAEKGFMFVIADTQTGLCHEVTERHRGWY